MAGKKRRGPVGIDTGVPTSVWEGPDSGGMQALGLGAEHASEGGSVHLIDKLHLEAQFSLRPLASRIGSLHIEHPHAEPSDYIGYESFRDAVLAQHIANSSRGGHRKPATDIPADELAVVQPGAKKDDPPLKLRKEAAAAVLKLLDAARKAVGAGATIEIGSAYRPVAHDRHLWLDYFGKYYWETLERRRQFYGGPLGLAAVVFMAHHVAKWKAAPGFSNHSYGIAVDFHYKLNGQWLKCAHAASSLQNWQKTPFYQWLHGTGGKDGHAKDFGFRPYSPEPWHWEYGKENER